MRRLCSVFLLTGVHFAIQGCSRPEATAPPELRVGRDECAECGMIVSEDRCSSAMLIARDGKREYALFDDIGCMLDYERTKTAHDEVVERYVHDYSTRNWVVTRSAVFLLADRQTVHTPMGSGIIAFEDQASADRARKEMAGDTMGIVGVASARRARSDALHNRPKDGP